MFICFTYSTYIAKGIQNISFLFTVMVNLGCSMNESRIFLAEYKVDIICICIGNMSVDVLSW